MYVNIEFYMKKTVGVAAATITATIVNILLNFIFVPLYPEASYVVAAYTTLVGYMVLFLLHYLLVKRLKMDHVYDIKFILLVLATTLAVCMGGNVLYSYNLVRYVIVLIYGGLVLVIGYKYRDSLIKFVKRKKKA